MSSPSTPGEPRTGQQLYHAVPFTPGRAVLVTLAAIGGIYGTQIVLVVAGVPALVASAGSYCVTLFGLWRYGKKRKLTAADFGLRRVPGRFIVAAAMIGISMWYLNAIIVALVDPPGDPKQLEEVVEQIPLVPTLLALTIFPAVVEELVFRGVLARGLATRWSINAIPFSAIGFAIYHVFPPQMVATLGLGLVLAFLTLRARSVVPSIIVHLLNNTIAVLLSRDEIPGAEKWFTAHALEMAAVALVLVVGGIAIAAKGTPA